MVCWNSAVSEDPGQSLVWKSFIAGLMVVAPNLQQPLNYTTSISPFGPLSVSSPNTLESCTLESNDVRMQCGREVVILTDTEPGDLWAITALLSQANALHCTEEEYPIKAIIGGGGYNSDMSHSMLKEYLHALQRQVVSDGSHFNISKSVYPGPTSPFGASAIFDDWGRGFGRAYRRSNTKWPSEDSLSTAIRSLANLKTILDQYEEPLLLGLRAPVELAVPWLEEFRRIETTEGQCVNVPVTPAYQQELDSSGLGSEFFSGALNGFKKSSSVLLWDTTMEDQMAAFFKRYVIAPDSHIKPYHIIINFEFFLMQAPRLFIGVQKNLLFAHITGRAPDGKWQLFTGRTTHFAADEQPEVFKQLSDARMPNSTLPRYLLGHTLYWNEAFLNGMSIGLDEIFIWANVKGVKDGAAHDKMWREVKSTAKQLSDEEIQFSPDRDARLEKFIQQLLDLSNFMGGLDLNDNFIYMSQNNLTDWGIVASSRYTSVDVKDILVPFITSGSDNVMKRMLQRADARITPNGTLAWGDAVSDSDSNMWITVSKGGIPGGQARSRQLVEDIKDIYRSVFQP